MPFKSLTKLTSTKIHQSVKKLKSEARFQGSTPGKLTDLLESAKITIEEITKKYALNYQQLVSFLENSFTNPLEIAKDYTKYTQFNRNVKHNLC